MHERERRLLRQYGKGAEGFLDEILYYESILESEGMPQELPRNYKLIEDEKTLERMRRGAIAREIEKDLVRTSREREFWRGCLTKRQARLVELLASGLPLSRCAEEMGISYQACHRLWRAIRAKLGPD
jgi:DNA-binding NarL/FixJ family response regulator